MKKTFFFFLYFILFSITPARDSNTATVRFHLCILQALFSSVVALRCHSFSRSPRAVKKKNCTRTPLHIVATACLPAWCARENSLQLQPRKKRTARRCFLFSTGFIPRCLTYSSTLPRLAACCSVTPISFFLSFVFLFFPFFSFKSVVQDDERVRLFSVIRLLENVLLWNCLLSRIY